MQQFRMNTKKRSLIGGGKERKRTKQEDWKLDKNKYGDGVAWFRGAMIGKGSFGSVFMANLKKPKSKYSYYPRIMAVKSAEVSVSGSIQKEKEVMDNLRGCPNVIKCFGEEITNGENGQMVYNLLLEYGSGGTLADLIKKSGGKRLLEYDIKRYTRSILRGLRHIHHTGYVHCDLKPDNILLIGNSKDGLFNAKIGDLGLAKRAKQSKKSKLGANWRGTVMYLSPEAVINGVQEAPADIWAVGCIVLEMLTGKPPWFSKDADVDNILTQIGNEKDAPCVPSNISTDGLSFLKGCFSRKVTCRLTADTLLDHPFLNGLLEVEETQDIVDINTITSSPEFYDDDGGDDEDEPWSSSYSDGSSYGLSSWSEEDDQDCMNYRNSQLRLPF